MPTDRARALDELASFLLEDTSFPPLLRDRSVSRATVADARALERTLAEALPGWHPQSFPRDLVGNPSSAGRALYRRWLAAYLAGLDAGIHRVAALVEPEHLSHRDRWVLGYDLGMRMTSGR